MEKKQEKIKLERERMKTEKKAKDEALKLLSDLKKKDEELRSLLKSEREEVTRLKKANEENLEKLQAEQAVSESLRTETERLHKALEAKTNEVDKVTEALEKVEKEELITYKDNVDKYLKSSEFETYLYEKAGSMHEEGFNDFLQFVGAGNVVNLEIHSVDRFRVAELENMEKIDQERLAAEWTFP